MAAVALRAVVWVLTMTAVFTPAAAEDMRELQWADLVEVVALDDPFEALTPSQLGDLSRVARIRGLQVAQSDVGEGLAGELAQATARCNRPYQAVIARQVRGLISWEFARSGSSTHAV